MRDGVKPHYGLRSPHHETAVKRFSGHKLIVLTRNTDNLVEANGVIGADSLIFSGTGIAFVDSVGILWGQTLFAAMKTLADGWQFLRDMVV